LLQQPSRLYSGDLLTHRSLYSPHIHTSTAFGTPVRTLREDPSDEPHYLGHMNPDEFSIPSYLPPLEGIETVQCKLVAEGWNSEETDAIILINPNSSDSFPMRKTAYRSL
jgi:hypothetical protein